MSDFEEYIRQSEPHKRKKGHAWQIAIGPQAVDGLKPSKYLKEKVRQYVERDIITDEVKQLADSYYKSKVVRSSSGDRTEEAGRVLIRTTEILSGNTFTFSSIEYLVIHRHLFKGMFSHTGQIRDYNIAKNEWVLKGTTVLYASTGSTRETLEYDFSREKILGYKNLNIDEAIRHIAQSASGIQQIHAFGEGNTHTIAVFTIRYLYTFRFNFSNETFANRSWYFRNALIRANYNDLTKGVYATIESLEEFFRNLILNEQNELKNQNLQTGEIGKEVVQSAEQTDMDTPRCKNYTLDCTLEEIAVLNYLKEKPDATQKEIAQHIGKSERTVKSMTINLSERGVVGCKNGYRSGFWETRK